MITDTMYARTTAILTDGLDDAVIQGWGPEAALILRPVRAALNSTADDARATITNQLRVVAADPTAARGLYIEAILQRAMDALTPEVDRDADARWEAELIADMNAFLGRTPA